MLNNSKTKTMNSVEKELHGYINGTERMSGFDDYESDMSYFDDDETGSDMSYAGGPQGSAAMSDPYVIQYVNTTPGNLTATLFGYNDNFGAVNFGNPAGITITNLQGGTYGRLLAQSNNKFFKIGKFRFQSATSSQLQQTLQLFHVDANGKQYSSPLNLSIMRDAYQFQADIIDVTKAVTIDGNSFITFTLIAAATLVISIFPTSVLSGKAELNGGTFLNRARAPRLSGKNVAPVIIQTSQGVKGITQG
jgi:hypothetical protein